MIMFVQRFVCERIANSHGSVEALRGCMDRLTLVMDTSAVKYRGSPDVFLSYSIRYITSLSPI